MKHPITRSAIDTAATVLMALASIFMIGFIGWTALVSGRSAPRTAERPAIENVQGKQVRTTISGAPVIGRSDARIVLVEYSDFECPFCRRFEGDTFPRIKAAFVDTGRIRYAFRHRPLSNVHKNAQAAAQAANCARNQGRFWEMRSALFGATSLEIQMLPAIAVSAGVNSQTFGECLSQQDDEIASQVQEADRLGITSTPTFLIALQSGDEETLEGIRIIRGARPFDQFEQALKDAIQTASLNP